MPSLQEIAASVYGAWRLALLDRSGMNWFNHSIEGFWRSFFVALLIAPLAALMVGFQLINADEGADTARLVTVEVVGYALGWVIYPVAALFVCRLMALTDYYVSYIIAYNWSHAIPAVVAVPIAMPVVMGLLPLGLAESILLIVTIAVLVYRWFIARVVLGADGLTAAALVALELMLQLLVYALAARTL